MYKVGWKIICDTCAHNVKVKVDEKDPGYESEREKNPQGSRPSKAVPLNVCNVCSWERKWMGTNSQESTEISWWYLCAWKRKWNIHPEHYIGLQRMNRKSVCCHDSLFWNWKSFMLLLFCRPDPRPLKDSYILPFCRALGAIWGEINSSRKLAIFLQLDRMRQTISIFPRHYLQHLPHHHHHLKHCRVVTSLGK